MPTLSVLISDDYPLVRLAITQLVKTTFPNSVLQEASNPSQLLEVITNHTFDLLILDNHLSIENNLSLMNTIRRAQPAIKILFFSDRNEQIYALPLLHAGANGFLAKGSSEEDFRIALSQILNKKKYLSERMQQNIMNQILEGSSNYNPSLTSILTTREIEVLNLLLKGFRTAEISNEMDLRPSTISTFKMKILKKMRVRNLVELSEKVKVYNSPLLT